MNQQANLIDLQHQTTQDARTALYGIVRGGARRMLQAAIEEEVTAYVEAHQNLRDEHGHRLVVRTGHLPERPVDHHLTGLLILTTNNADQGAISSAPLHNFLTYLVLTFAKLRAYPKTSNDPVILNLFTCVSRFARLRISTRILPSFGDSETSSE